MSVKLTNAPNGLKPYQALAPYGKATRYVSYLDAISVLLDGSRNRCVHRIRF